MTWQGAQRCAPTVLSFLLLFHAPLFGFNSHQPFDISADVLDYVDDTQEITANGHVVIVQSSSTLHADLVRVDRVHQRLIARGQVMLKENQGVMLGDQLDYDLAAQKGVMLGGKGYSSTWFFQGASWEKTRDYYVGRNASFTSCDLIDPHYHIKSSRVHLIPDRLFWAWNNVFYVDDHPVFYSPFMYKSLGQRTVDFQVQPGEDSVKGAFAKTTTTIRIKDHVYDKILLDHYTLSGTGYGNEFDYQDPKYKGSLFGYYINPKGSPELAGAPKTEQYNMRFYHWQKLSDALTFQSNINHRNNVSFSNEFFPQDTFQSVSDVTNSSALTYQKGKVNQRLVIEGQEGIDSGADPLFGAMHIQTASLPRYDITLYQMPLWSPQISTSTLQQALHPNILGPLQFTANGSAQNNYTRADEVSRLKGNGSAALSQAITLSRKWSLTPSLSPSLSWQDKYAPFTPVVSTGPVVVPIGIFRGYQGRMNGGGNLRYRASSDLTIDQTYSLTYRLAPNSATLDRSLQDGGIETHHVNWLVFWRPSRLVMHRSFSGYDLRQLAEEGPAAYRQRRFDPWNNELTYQPRASRLEYFFRHQLGYYPTRTLLWEADVKAALNHKTTLTTGLIYNKSQPGFVTLNTQVGYYLSPGWRVDTLMNFLVPTDTAGRVRDGVITQSEFIVTRDMHCWTAQFIYRDRPPFTHEFSLLFNLKMGGPSAKPIADRDLEGQFYSWRATRDVDPSIR